MNVLVNLRGTNGSGKSTIAIQMLEKEKDNYQVICLNNNNRSPKITLFPGLGWLVLGTYFNKTGGLDTYKNNIDTENALNRVLYNYPKYDILMEGIISSTILSTYITLFNTVKDNIEQGVIPPRKIIIATFVTPLDICVDRVRARNDKEPNIKIMDSKRRSCIKNISLFKQAGFISIGLDSSNTPIERMLPNFLRTCNKYRKNIQRSKPSRNY